MAKPERSDIGRDLRLPTLPAPRMVPPKSFLGHWFLKSKVDEPHGAESTHPWYRVPWLTGVDYFSTLGYQPGIALLAAGALSPLATGILLLVTVLGALPIYSQVAARSFAGQGSIAMLENLLSGWAGKLFVVVLFGLPVKAAGIIRISVSPPVDRRTSGP